MRIKWKLLIVGLLLVSLAATVVAWSQANSGLTVNITPGGTAGHVVISQIPIGQTFAIYKGCAQKVSGISLYKIVLVDPLFSNLLRINIALTNSPEIGKVLNNPGAFIEVGIYSPDPINTSRIVLNRGVDNGTRVLQDTGASASGVLSLPVGDITIYPNITGQSTLYILASITIPSGPPPGQQSELEYIRFYLHIDVRGASAS